MNAELKFKNVGYWRGGYFLARPKVEDFIDPSWDSQERESVLDHVADRKHERRSLGGSARCRLCKRGVGRQEVNDGIWQWPQGLYHYITEHDVKPDQAFIDHCMAITGIATKKSNLSFIALAVSYRGHRYDMALSPGDTLEDGKRVAEEIFVSQAHPWPKEWGEDIR